MTNKLLYNRYIKHNFKALDRALNDYLIDRSVDNKADLIDALRNKIEKISKGSGWYQYAVHYENNAELCYKIKEDNIVFYFAYSYLFISINDICYKFDYNQAKDIIKFIIDINKRYNTNKID